MAVKRDLFINVIPRKDLRYSREMILGMLDVDKIDRNSCNSINVLLSKLFYVKLCVKHRILLNQHSISKQNSCSRMFQIVFKYFIQEMYVCKVYVVLRF